MVTKVFTDTIYAIRYDVIILVEAFCIDC